MRILIIEDRKNLAELLKKGLVKEGHAVDYLTDGEAGLTRVKLHHKDYDVLVLDLMMPKKTGFEVCKEIRAAGISLPILVLTARDSLRDKVSLLDMGADDYLVKPFELEEILARLRALTRRPEQVLPTELQVYDLILNPATRKVTRAGKDIKLTLTEFRLLEYLMRHANQVVERVNLETNVWDFNFDSFSNIIDVYINHLRAKIDRGHDRKLIETVRGIGYRVNTV